MILYLQASIAKDNHRSVPDAWSTIDSYRRTDFSLSILKNYNLTYSFYKNTYSWDLISALDGLSQVPSSALQYQPSVLPADNNLTELDYKTNNETLSDSGSNIYGCSRCKCEPHYSGVQTPVVNMNMNVCSRVVGMHTECALCWYDGRKRLELLILYGFRAGKYYRWHGPFIDNNQIINDFEKVIKHILFSFVAKTDRNLACAIRLLGPC